MPTTAEWISTFRTFAVVPTVIDTLGIEDRRPGLMDLGRAQITAQVLPFAQSVADIDAYCGDDLDSALAGPKAADAETQAHRIIAEHLAAATMRLALSAAAGSQVDWAAATAQTLR